MYQDLPSQHPSAIEQYQRQPYDVPVHTVTPIPSTPLAALLGDGPFTVNSYHHQAVKALAPAWSAMAVAPDGVIEAAYMPDRRFVWAVQWHPEVSFRVDENGRKLFHAFVRAAGEGMGSRENDDEEVDIIFSLHCLVFRAWA